MNHHPKCVKIDSTSHGHDCEDVNGHILLVRTEPADPSEGEPPQKVVCSWHVPVQHRDGKEPWCNGCRLNADGNPVRGVFGSIETPVPLVGEVTGNYATLEHSTEQVGELKAEVWKGTFMPNIRPDGPRVEMTISDERGTSITVSAEVDADTRKDYDHEMLSDDVTRHAMRLYNGIRAGYSD